MKSSAQKIGTGALLIISNCILVLIWGNDSNIYLFDSHSKNDNGNLPISSTSVLLKLIVSIENVIKYALKRCDCDKGGRSIWMSKRENVMRT